MVFSILILICVLVTLIAKKDMSLATFIVAGVQTSYSFFTLFIGQAVNLLFLAVSAIIIAILCILKRKELKFSVLLPNYFIFLVGSALLSGVLYLTYFR